MSPKVTKARKVSLVILATLGNKTLTGIFTYVYHFQGSQGKNSIIGAVGYLGQQKTNGIIYISTASPKVAKVITVLLLAQATLGDWRQIKIILCVASPKVSSISNHTVLAVATLVDAIQIGFFLWVSCHPS